MSSDGALRGIVSRLLVRRLPRSQTGHRRGRGTRLRRSIAWLTVLRAYVDESGDRGASPTATDFFVMAAAVVNDENRPGVQGRLAAIRHHLNKPPGTVLHFASNIREHGARVYVCQQLGGLAALTVTNVVMCKRLFEEAAMLTTDPQAVYLYTLRLMLERLSWIARDRNETVVITFAHVKNFPYRRLHEYLDILRGIPTSIHWEAIQDVRINQPKKLELLQVADVAASSVLRAFQPDRHGVTEQRYLNEFATRLYRRPPGSITSYGMKLHPAIPALAQFPWVANL